MINYAVALPVICVFINSMMRQVFYLMPKLKDKPLLVGAIDLRVLVKQRDLNPARNVAWRGRRVGARAGTRA